MDEIQTLPKLTNDQHSSTSGPLANYQNSISEQLMIIIGRLQHNVKSISDKTNEKLSEKLKFYQSHYEQMISDSQNIIDSMTSTSSSFDDLRDILKSYGTNILTEFSVLKTECVDIYTESFKEIKPFVENAYSTSKVILPQIPKTISDRLPAAITQINISYLNNKQNLSKSLYQIEIQSRKSIQNFLSEFEQKKDNWKNHRFDSLVEQAKIALDPSKFCDFDAVFQEFYKEQHNFVLCFKKNVLNLSVILPPDHFHEEEYEHWVAEIDELIEIHNNFLNIFEGKFADVISSQMAQNSQLISQLETELVELRNETEANQALAEIYPLFKASQKVNGLFVEKVHKYWEHRKNCIKTSFDAIKSFLQPIIAAYNKFVNEMNDTKLNGETMIQTMKNDSKEKLEELENQLSKSTQEITLMATDEEIDNKISECKDFLTQIETEYHQHYTQLIELFDSFPNDFQTVFEQNEIAILPLLQLRKVDNTIPLNDSKALKKSSSHCDRRQKASSIQLIQPVIIKIQDAKFEEIEPLNIIPNFDDFIDEPIVQTPQKGNTKSSKQKKPTKAKANLKNSKSLQKGIKPTLEDCEDLEISDFSLLDVVPKFDDVISIFVYSPTPEEISDWLSQLRIQVTTQLYSTLASSLAWANDETRRNEAANELNEKVRTHMPRMSSIELNIGEARKLQIEFRKTQQTAFFRRQISHFNSSYSKLEIQLKKLFDNIFNECELLRKFNDDLYKIKSTPAFSLLHQNQSIVENNFQVHFDKYLKEQDKEINDFIDFFTQSSSQYQENVFMKDDSYSREEREIASQHFKRLFDAIQKVHNDLLKSADDNKTKIESLKGEIVEEYNTALPIHKADVAFLESLTLIQQEYKSKYESLLIQNNSMQKNIDKSILKLNESIIFDLNSINHQTKIKQMFSLLEELRVNLVSRGLFLKQLNSKISPNQFTYDVSFDSEIQAEPNAVPNNITSEKNSGRKSKMVKSTPNKTQENKKPNPNTEKKVVSLPNSTSNTFEGKLNQLKKNFISSISNKSNEYFSSLKTRTMPITRPEIIPSVQQDLVNEMSEKWDKMIENVPSVLNECESKYRFSVVISSDISRKVIQALLSIFTDFYKQKIKTQNESIKLKFDRNLKILRKERKSNQNKLSPKYADQNLFSEFNQLYLNEENRNNREKQLIMKLYEDVFENEKCQKHSFLNVCNLFVKNMFNLFDKFPLVEDIKDGKYENVTRKTMRDLLKEKKRSTIPHQPNSSLRPFHTREWHLLNSKNETKSVSNENNDQTTSENKKKSTKRRVSGGKSDKNTDSKTTNEIQPESPITGLNVSLETPLHRLTVQQRNQCYEDYEKCLNENLESVNELKESLLTDNKMFEEFWMKSVYQIMPDFTPEKPELDLNDQLLTQNKSQK